MSMFHREVMQPKKVTYIKCDKCGKESEGALEKTIGWTSIVKYNKEQITQALLLELAGTPLTTAILDWTQNLCPTCGEMLKEFLDSNGKVDTSLQ